MRQVRAGRGSAWLSSRFVPGAMAVVGLTLIGATLHVPPAHSQTTGALPRAAQVAIRDLAARPTAGWTNFCQRYPSECAVDSREPALVRLTSKVWHLMVDVNRQVNALIRPMTDRDHWGVEDRWDFAEDGYGDCEDYQLVKRKRLVEAGLPHRALRMTVVVDERGEGHAVMMIRTDRGDFILDNKRDSVLPWTQTGYTYVKREGDSGQAWASLGGVATGPVVTAGR
jgi:predicted transglutaminase-like cysteine proteinase